MNVPFHNGKIQMGKYYQKPQYVEEDSDMIRIQSALIGCNRQARLKFYANVSYLCLLVVAVVLGIVYG